MLTLQSKFSEYLTLILGESPCANQLIPFGSIAPSQDLTVDEAFDILDKENTLPEAWIVWTFIKFGAQLGEDIRLRLLTKVVTPMTAFQMYLKIIFLTDNEDIALKTVFGGQLPVAEKELDDGIVVRAKGNQ